MHCLRYEGLKPTKSTFFHSVEKLPWSCKNYLHWPWTVFWRIHSASACDKLQHFLVGFTGIRHVTQREDLPQQDSERPAGGATAQQSTLILAWSLNSACSTDGPAAGPNQLRNCSQDAKISLTDQKESFLLLVNMLTRLHVSYLINVFRAHTMYQSCK